VAAAQLLDGPERPTAIFACNDEMAVAVLQEARARRIRIPEDLSVIGFDDTTVSQIAIPAITTVHQPLEEVGRMSVNLLARIMDEPPLHPVRLEVGTRLVVRESTGPAPGR
jgi:LacI family transcriptional regulator